MIHIGLTRRRICSAVKPVCLVTFIIGAIIILSQQHHYSVPHWDQVSDSQGRIISSSGSWNRVNRDPSILSRKVKNHQESIPRSGGWGGSSSILAPASAPNYALSQQRIKGPQELFSVNRGIQVESFLDNCGLNHDCPDDHFSIHLFTGSEDKIHPKLCVDGKYILDKGINGCGRGINVALIDSLTKSIISVSNYDTYDKDSSSLENLLLNLREGDIVIFLTFDEPSSKLSQVARLLLHELGSGKAQNLNYRTSWYLITQKGIQGYSPYEEIHLPSYNASQAAKSVWGSPHDIRMCLPLHVEGVPVQADETIRKNPDRQDFCRKFAHIWPYFCESHVVNDPLIPSTVSRIPVSNELFKTPILLLTRGSIISELSDLSLTLETLLRQPGIEPKNVIVFYNQTCCSSVRRLVNLFGFMSIAYPEQAPGEQKEIDLLKDSLQTTQLLFPDSHQLILMESHLILSPDFLPFFGQMIPILSNTESGIQAVSAWNENGLMKTSADPSLVFRADATRYPARFAVMLNRIQSFAEFDRRESKSSSWSFDTPGLPFSKTDDTSGALVSRSHIIFPDMSRVSIIIASLQRDQEQIVPHEDAFLQHYMSRARNLNMDEDARILNTNQAYDASNYETSLRHLISNHPLYSLDEAVSLVQSVDQPGDHKKPKAGPPKIMIVDAGSSHDDWDVACKYFGLVNCHPQLELKGIGQVIRFTIPAGSQVLLVMKQPDQTSPREA